MKILIVEDEKLLADSLKYLLIRKGFEADAVYDGETGSEYLDLGIYDLVILDVMLPKLSGFELAKRVRRLHNHIPILMLTARSDVRDRVEGLNSGADYYLTKPFDTRELLACVNALLRRTGDQVDTITFGNTTLDLARSQLSGGGEQIRLSAKEFEVMRILMENQERNVPKETLLVKVWGFESSATENNVEVYVGFLRKKLKRIGSNLEIVSVRRMGYHLEVSKP